MKTPLKRKTVTLTQFAMLLAIEALVCFTPLGSLPAVGPIVATLGMVPVIITAILLGTGAGACMGAFAGLFSFLVWTFAPPNPLMAFVFTPFYMLGATHGNVWSLVICFVPRILVGVVAGTCFKLFTRLNWKSGLAYGLSGVLGSLVNTFGVLGGIYVFFGHSYATVLGKGFDLLLGLIGLTILTNGIPEAIIGGVAAYAVCRPLRRYMKRDIG
ncbi:MAG TPA: ECF transporter S component [Candidatus Deferrimicrobium sp.]|nr:ECF transporter S component [Candidatus Deferrimicrobium sp.]